MVVDLATHQAEQISGTDVFAVMSARRVGFGRRESQRFQVTPEERTEFRYIMADASWEKNLLPSEYDRLIFLKGLAWQICMANVNWAEVLLGVNGFHSRQAFPGIGVIAPRFANIEIHHSHRDVRNSQETHDISSGLLIFSS